MMSSLPKSPRTAIRDQLIHRARATIGRAQPAAQDGLAADDEGRQEAMVVITAVEVSALPVAMDRIVGGIEIQNDLPGRFRMALQEQVHKNRASWSATTFL